MVDRDEALCVTVEVVERTHPGGDCSPSAWTSILYKLQYFESVSKRYTHRLILRLKQEE